jgi:cephalosporin hydroxylase
MSDLDAMNEVGQNPAELARAILLYYERDPKRVLEIGVWHGGTLREWLTNGAPEVVVAVDPVHLNPERYEGWRQPDTKLVAVSGQSQDDAAMAVIRAYAPYDWVFIDGDHSTEGVEHDISLTAELMAPGGHMLIHDITAPDYPPTPPRVAFDSFPGSWEINEPRPDWYPSTLGSGIGVIEF